MATVEKKKRSPCDMKAQLDYTELCGLLGFDGPRSRRAVVRAAVRLINHLQGRLSQSAAREVLHRDHVAELESELTTLKGQTHE